MASQSDDGAFDDGYRLQESWWQLIVRVLRAYVDSLRPRNADDVNDWSHR